MPVEHHPDGENKSRYEPGFGPPLAGEDELVYRKPEELPEGPNDVVVIAKRQVYPFAVDFDWDKDELFLELSHRSQDRLLTLAAHALKSLKLKRVHNAGGQLMSVELHAVYAPVGEIKKLRQEQEERIKRAQEQERKFGEVGLTAPKDPAVGAAETGESKIEGGAQLTESSESKRFGEESKKA